MILIDVSSILHRMISGSTKDVNKISVVDGKFRTEDFIYLTLHYILSEIINMQIKYNKWGEVVLCFDDYKKAYWRRDVYPDYKLSRRVGMKNQEMSDEITLNYNEIFSYTNILFNQLRENTPWKCIYVNNAEADDIILVLAECYHNDGVLILSPDKDFLQSQRHSGVCQYSSLTHKWLVPEDKHGNMSNWIYKHVMLGDVADGVPKVVDGTEFSEAMKKHLESLNVTTNVYEFKKLTKEEKIKALKDFHEKTYNRKGQETGLDIYETNRFGVSHLEKIKDGRWKQTLLQDKLKEQKSKILLEIKQSDDKELKKELRLKSKELTKKINEIPAIEKEANLDEFLDSHQLYREHYDRNYILVMEEGIPEYIRKNILLEYETADISYNEDEFFKYLDTVNLQSIKGKLPLVFKSNAVLDVASCGWDF